MTDLTREGLVELADRVANAREQDWSLNNAVWLHVGEELGGEWTPKMIRPIRPSEIIAGSQMQSAFDRFPDDPGGIAFSWRVPDFTGSLDAAMTLVPEGCFPHVGKSKGMPKARTWYADCAPPDRTKWEDWYTEAEAATPALALLSSALRARAMEAGQTTGATDER